VNFNPAADGVTISFLDGDGKIACLMIPPGSAGWSVDRTGTQWSFKDARDNSLGDPGANDLVGIKLKVAKGIYEVKVKIKGVELLDPDAGTITTGVIIGGQRWVNQQGWKSAATGKKLQTP